MASAIFFNGRRINIPQAVSRIDASALAAVSPAAVGIVALVGTAEGGKPLSVEESEVDFTSPDALRDYFRSGNLKTGGLFAFEPSTDPAIPGGAQRVIAVKVNPATQSTAQLVDSSAQPSVDLTSRDWGQFTEQINVDVDDGTSQGKKIVVVFEDDEETFDDVGGDPIMDVIFDPGSDGYDSVDGAINASGFLSTFSKAESGLTSQRDADIPSEGKVEVQSDDAGDDQDVTIYGLDGSNNAVRETLTLDGTTTVTGEQDFAKVLGAELSEDATGTVTVDDTSTTTLFTFDPGTTTRGIVKVTNGVVANDTLTVSIDSDTAVDVAVFGIDPSDAKTGERFDMTNGATTPVVGSQDFKRQNVIALGDVDGARTITVEGNAANAGNSTFPTIQKLVDRLNLLDGYTANALVSNPTSFEVEDADYASAVSLIGGEAEFFADLFFFIDILNSSSQYVSAERASGATARPANTADPVFLTGGEEGSPSMSEWNDAFTLLQKRRVNIIVPLTDDEAVHSLLATHLVARAGRLKSEANGYIGIGDDGAGETLTNIKSQIQVIQTRHISAISQEVERFDPDTGEATWYPPYMFAAIAAGMQAGSVIGEPLTRKRPLAIDIRNDDSWSVEDDASSLIDAGLMIAEKVDGVGIRWVRSITTHLADDNIVFTEMSANESANTAVFELRRRLDSKIGQRALGGTAATIKGLAQSILGQLIDDEIIVAFRNVQVEQIGDVFPVSVEIAPVVPINFIPITVHLVAVRAAA